MAACMSCSNRRVRGKKLLYNPTTWTHQNCLPRLHQPLNDLVGQPGPQNSYQRVWRSVDHRYFLSQRATNAPLVDGRSKEAHRQIIS